MPAAAARPGTATAAVVETGACRARGAATEKGAQFRILGAAARNDEKGPEGPEVYFSTG